MKRCLRPIRLPVFFLLLASVVAHAATFTMPAGSNYFNGHLFSTFTGANGVAATTGQASSLHTFTVTQIGGALGTGTVSQFASGLLPAGSGYPAATPRMAEMGALNGLGVGGRIRYTFNQALPLGTHVYMQDVDQGETAQLQFYTCAGVLINPSGFDYLVAATSSAPTAVFSATTVTLTNSTGATNQAEPLVAVIIRNATVCRVEYTGTFAGGTFETYFSLPPVNPGITKSLATPNPVIPGGPVSWTLTATNNAVASGITGLSNPTPAYGVTISDTVSSSVTGLTAVVTNAGGTTGGSCTIGAGNAVTCSGFSPLASGQSIVVTLTGTLFATYNTTTLANTGTVTNSVSNDLVAGNNSATSTTPVTLPPTFGTCDARMFLEQTNTATTLSTLYNVAYTSAPFTYTSLGTGSPRNGIGYNTLDNYIYGMEWGGGLGNELIRVGANGSSQNLGVVSGLPVSNYNNGVISPTGDYYVVDPFNGGSNMYRINLTTRVATLIPLSRAISVSDIAWYSGSIRGIDNNTGALISVNPATGAVTTIGSSSPVTNAISMWGFNNGLFAGTGSAIYAVDPATGTVTLMSTSPTASNADGANCPGADIQFNADLSVTKTNTPASGVSDLPTDTFVPGETRTYSIVVRNTSGSFGAQNVTVSDPVPAGINAATMSWTCAATSGGSRCGAASGTGALNDTGLDLPAGAVATYLVTMTVPTTFTGDLSNTVTITPPSTINDTNTANNTATDVDQLLQQPSFGTCDARMFLDQVNVSVTPNQATLYEVGYASAPFTYTSLGSGLARNALGYNPVDNYIYGIEWNGLSGNELIRVGADGSSFNLGVITGLPIASYAAGVVSPAGDYYVTSDGVAGSTLYRINVTTRTVTTITMSRSIQVFDLAWQGSLLYAIDVGQLISINPTTGAVTNIGSTAPIGVSIATWGFANALYTYRGGADSGIYAIDPVTGAATLASTAPLASNADGANCPTASIQFNADLSVTKTNTPASGPNDLPNDTFVPGETRTYSIVVTNGSSSFGAQNITVSDPVPAGISAGTVSWTCAGTSGGAVCGAASGTGALNDTRLDLPPGAVATYLLTMTVPAGFTGDLSNTASITPPSNINDANTANNTASDVDQSAPQLTIRKISLGGVDSFGFTGTNGVVAQTLTTTVAGSPVSGTIQALSAPGTLTTITETATPETYRVTDIVCTGLGAGGTATPDLANRAVTLDAAATAVGANIVCTFTNTLQQTDIQVVKTASPASVLTGGVVTYTIVVSNAGPVAVANAVLTDVPASGQTCTVPSTTASCSATGGASCPAATVPVADLLAAGVTIPSLPVGGQVTVVLQCTVSATGLP